jgi:Na+/H+ antiporter NhaD/arsenite permease-like protein
VGDAISGAAGQAWPPFVLIAGLLLIGAVVEADGLFAALGTRIERARGGPVALLSTLLGLQAVVTAGLNLDTAVAFMTPIILQAARANVSDLPPRKRAREWP